MVDWNALRDDFPVTREWVFLDHAAVAPLSRPARDAIGEYLQDLTDNGDVNGDRWNQRVEDVRALAARLIHASPDEIAFVKNTSEGIGFVAEGLDWRDGDNVVTAAEEYPSNIYPWMNLADRGVELRLVESRDHRIHLSDIDARIDARTRLVAISFVEYSTGFRNNLDALSRLCRRRGVLLMVDAIQGLGVLPLDVSATPIDFLCADGHKWLLGPEGAGLFYVRRACQDRLRVVSVGWHSVVDPLDFARIHFELKPHAGRWENGTFNIAGITGMGGSIELLLRVGLEHIADRVLGLTDRLCERLTEVGARIISPRAEGQRSGIVSFVVDGVDATAIRRHARQQQIVITQRAGRVRVSPHFYNTEQEMDQVADVVRQVCRRSA